MAILTPRQTNIIHEVRQRLDITPVDYMVADCINFICSYKKNQTKTATGNYRRVIAQNLGFGFNTINRSIQDLMEKDLVRTVSIQSIEITEKWQEAIGVVNIDSTQNGASFFSIYIHKKQEICPNLPVLSNFKTSFLNEFRIFGFQPSSFLAQKIVNGAAMLTKHTQHKAQKIVNGAAIESSFAEFYAAYPRKEKRDRAFATYQKMAKHHIQIMQAVVNYSNQIVENKTEKRFTMLPQTFLNCYEDHLPEPSTTEDTQKIVNGAAVNNTKQDDFREGMAILGVVVEKYATSEVLKAQKDKSAFELLNIDGARLFTDNQACWIEQMGGLENVWRIWRSCDFDEKALGSWYISQRKVHSA